MNICLTYDNFEIRNPISKLLLCDHKKGFKIPKTYLEAVKRRKDNDQQKKGKRTNHGLENTTQKN